MNRLAFRCLLPVLLTALSGAAYALGLGELRGQPSLGEHLRLEIDILGEGKAGLDATCFRLVQPSRGGDLPWLKKASLSIRKGKPPVLEIRNDMALREPVTQVAVQVGCGYDVSREYVVLASPGRDVGEPQAVAAVTRERQPRVSEKSSVIAPRVRTPKAADTLPPSRAELPPRVPQRPVGPAPTNGMPDRLMISSGAEVGDPSLRISTDLPDGRQSAVTDAQRDVLRLEYRMLAAMNEQATTQLETAEKLRKMEGTLGELQQHATEFSQRVEKDGAPVAATPAPQTPAAVPPPAPEESSNLGLYGVVIGALVGLLLWFGWKKYRSAQDEDSLLDDEVAASPDAVIDPRRDGEREEPGIVDLPVEPPVAGRAAAVDLELDAGPASPEKSASVSHSESLDSVLSVSATTLDEHFEANPVMELADIMLSFGRVKGAAQALQEYIDHNPQEALQPWIRLMDVYRMAGMREEFDAVARSLNQNFNVEVQEWAQSEGGQASVDLVLGEDGEQAASAVTPVAPKPQGVEDMPRIMSSLCELWAAGDVLGYMYQLLRDNRGGQRVGFALPVVEDVLFLIDIKEAVLRAEKEAAAA